MKTPTIKRKPTWPKWARWYAVDQCGSPMLYDVRPVHSRSGMHWWALGRDAKWSAHMIARCRKPYRTDAWKRSLRRITP